jgi:hypothetical protein
LGSCSKKEFLPDLKGNMVGYVYCFNEFDSTVLSNNNRVLVKAYGTNDTYFAYSDNNGRFEFEDLPAGTYELHFLKDGYGTLKQFGIKHLGGEPTVLNAIFDYYYPGSAYYLHALPTAKINEIKIENNNVNCSIAFGGTHPKVVYIQLYMSAKENVDLNSAEMVLTNIRLRRNGDIYSGSLSEYVKNYPMPFKSAEQVFFKACASPFYGANLTLGNHWYITGIDTYFDYENNQIVYPALGKESVQNSFIMP